MKTVHQKIHDKYTECYLSEPWSEQSDSGDETLKTSQIYGPQTTCLFLGAETRQWARVFFYFKSMLLLLYLIECKCFYV